MVLKMHDSTREIGRKFQTLQENRVQTYKELNKAHEKYLLTGPDYDFKTYQQEVSKATNQFNEISTQIINLEKNLIDADAADLASFIRQVRFFLNCI